MDSPRILIERRLDLAREPEIAETQIKCAVGIGFVVLFGRSLGYLISLITTIKFRFVETQKVIGFYVQMQNPQPMTILQRLCHLTGCANRIRDRQLVRESGCYMILSCGKQQVLEGTVR